MNNDSERIINELLTAVASGDGQRAAGLSAEDTGPFEWPAYPAPSVAS